MMVTFTVMAGLVTVPEAGVIEIVDDLLPAGDPLQPTTTISTSMAPANPICVRNRRTEGIINSIAIAIMIKIIWRSNADGGAFKDCGGTMNAEAVMDPAAEAPGAGAALVVATEHELISMPGVQVKDTAPVKPPNPVTSTGNEPVAPLATLMAAAETEKSHAVPLRASACGLPPELSVKLIVPVTEPGAVPAAGAKVTFRTQAVPPGAGAMTIGKVLPHEFEAIAKPLLMVIAEILSAVVVLVLFTVSICGALVVFRSWPPNAGRLAGENEMLATVVLPVPESATSIGWPVPSRASKICRVVASAPDIDGVKVTPTVQEVPAGTDPTHVPVVVVAKSPVLPVMFDGAGVKATADPVLFVIVTNCACVGVPTSCVPKAMLVGV